MGYVRDEDYFGKEAGGMATEELINLLNQGVEVWNQWRAANPSKILDLNHAKLRGADLRGVNLRDVLLIEADLFGAHLHGADLRGANLNKAYMQCATLYGAK